MANEKKYDPILAVSGIGGGHLEATVQGKRALLSVVSGDRVSYNLEATIPAAGAPSTFRFPLGVRSCFFRATKNCYVSAYEGKTGTAPDGTTEDGRFFLAAGERVQLPWGTNTIEVQSADENTGTLYAEGRV